VGGDAADAAEDLNARERFRVFTFCSIADKLSAKVERTRQVYKDVSTQFSFLNKLRVKLECRPMPNVMVALPNI